MQTTVVCVQADKRPMEGIVEPGPHQLYVNPRVSVQRRELGALNPDEIRVEMIYAGICGTDAHLVQTDPQTGYIRCSAPARIPPEGRVIGHEGVGRVLEIGSRVRHVKRGALVTFESIIVCHYCDVCRRGDFNQCRRARLLGLEKDGLFGTIVDVPSLLSHDVSELAGHDDGLRAAACLEPAGVAYVACENSRIGPGDVVAVFGGGPIGVLTAQLSRVAFGASEVHLVEPVKFRREFAARWCDRTYDVEEFFERAPKRFDVIVESSGRVDNVARMLRRVNANGRIALLGRSGTALTLDAVDHLITNEITLVGSRGHLGGAFAKVLSLYAGRRIALGEIVTSVFNGVETMSELLQSPRRIIEENCKVLVRLAPVSA